MNDYLYKSFPCRHDEDAEHKLNNVYRDALEFLGCGPQNFLSAAIQVLYWNYKISIENLAVDQWFAISGYRWENWDFDKPKTNRIWVECDRLEDGLADLVIWAKKTFKGEDEIPTGGTNWTTTVLPLDTGSAPTSTADTRSSEPGSGTKT